MTPEQMLAIVLDYERGVLGHGAKAVGQRHGVSAATVRRIVNPAERQRDREASLKRKQRRRGVCERCGGETRYSGRTGVGVSTVCKACALQELARRAREHAVQPEQMMAALHGWVAEHGRVPSEKQWITARMRPSHMTIQREYGSWGKFLRAGGYVEAAARAEWIGERVRAGLRAAGA